MFLIKVNILFSNYKEFYNIYKIDLMKLLLFKWINTINFIMHLNFYGHIWYYTIFCNKEICIIIKVFTQSIKLIPKYLCTSVYPRSWIEFWNELNFGWFPVNFSFCFQRRFHFILIRNLRQFKIYLIWLPCHSYNIA